MKIKKRILTILIVFAMCIGCLPVYAEDNSTYSDSVETSAPAETSDPVEAFVERLYTNILQRDPDADGLQDWTNVLKSGQEQGARVAQGFIESPEFMSRSLTDTEYLTILYHTFLDREADAAGLAAWQQVLNDGLSRLHVFKGFVESDEFTAICADYGIIRGNASLTAPMDQNEGVTRFIVRCYRLCLGREVDQDGLNSWYSQLLNGANTAKDVAYGFVFSDEFQSKNLSDEDYIKVLYRVFMDREADRAGLSDWLGILAQGQNRFDVFAGFADSKEFQDICDNYGIECGPSYQKYEITDGNLSSSVIASSWLIYDAASGKIIYSRNPDGQVQLASQTKIMTAMVVLEHVTDLDAPVTMTASAASGMSWDTTRAGLVEGRSYTVRTLLEGLLVYSGGDCANLLAEYTAGSIDEFVQMMNDKAAELGMSETLFSDPIGLYDNHTTPREYVKLLKYADYNSIFRSIVCMPSCDITDIQGVEPGRHLANSNGLISGYVEYDHSLYTVDGVKTGTTETAGYCLTASANNAAGRRIIVAVFNSTGDVQRAVDAKTLLDFAFSETKDN